MNSNLTETTGWDICKTTGKSGTGHWRFWDIPFTAVERAAGEWHAALSGVKKPWLCWNINERWCILQQRLITEFGWTPVVGWDPNCGAGRPQLVKGAIAIDFNNLFDLECLYPHIPLEFAFLWTEKLAFWHADLILPRMKMSRAVRLFESLAPGEMAAVLTYGGMRNIVRPKYHRYWEVLGCTTAEVSRDQFEKGCGWWRGFQHHPNAPTDQTERAKRDYFYDDHGCGIRYWQRFLGGRVRTIREGWIAKEHFSAITTVKGYKGGRHKGEELDMNFDLEIIARRLGIADLLP